MLTARGSDDLDIDVVSLENALAKNTLAWTSKARTVRAALDLKVNQSNRFFVNAYEKWLFLRSSVSFFMPKIRATVGV